MIDGCDVVFVSSFVFGFRSVISLLYEECDERDSDVALNTSMDCSMVGE